MMAVMLLALVLALPCVPLAAPVRVRVGAQMWIAGTTHVKPVEPPSQGLNAYAFTGSPLVTGPDGITYRVAGPTHVNALRVGTWVYYLVTFRGDRKRP